MSFPPYPNYKPSGVEWLGNVPEHWQILALKKNFQIVGGSTPKSEIESFWDGDIPWATPSDLSKLETVYIKDTQRKITAEGLASCGTTLVPESSIILSTRAPIGSLAIAKTSLCTNQGCKSLLPSEKTNTEYFAHLLSICSAELNIRGKGTTFLEISGDELGSFKTPVPPLDEQTRIAAFLDRETAKIDELVAEQQRLLELLKEKRQAVISHAVTRGLNPAAPLKPSGIEWLGDIPAHWEVKPLKYSITKIEQGWSPQCESRPADDEEWGVLKVGCGNRDRFDPNEQKALPPEIAPEPTYEVKNGDILVSRGNSLELVGMATLVENVRPRLLLSDLLYRFRAKPERAIGKFVVLALRSPNVRFQIERDAVGTSASMKKIGQGVIREFTVALPPLAEQAAIVAHLDTELATFDTLTTEAQRAIELLQERRTALISAAVTGQIDVRSAS